MNKKNNQQRNNKKTKLALFWWSIGGVITIALLISAAVAFPLNFETSLVVSSSSQQSNNSSSEVTTNSLSLVGIEVDKLPSKLTYSAIDTIETSGGILRLVFSDYSVRYVSMNDNMIDTTRLNTSSVGSSRVTLSYSFNGDTLFTSYNVNIVPFVINPTSLSLDIASSDVLLDQVVNLNYIIEPSNATYSNIVWSSSNPLIATVDNNGLVTSKNIGEVVITATVDNNLSAVSRINVISEKNLPSETSAPQPEQQTPQDPIYTSTLLILDQPDNYSFSYELDYIDFDFSTNLSILTDGNLKSRYDVNPININSNLFKGVVYTFSATAGSSYQVNTTSQNSDTLIFVFSAPILDILSDLVNYNLDSSFLFFNDNKANGNTNSSVTFTSNISQNYEFLVLSKYNLGSGSILVSQFSTFDGYFLSNDISKPLTTLNLPIPSGTSQVNALSVLPTIVYEKDINGLFSPVNLAWGLANQVVYSSDAGEVNGVIAQITNIITSGNNTTTINGNLTIMATNAIPISSATQLSQIKPYFITTAVTFGEGVYETTKSFTSTVSSSMGQSYYLTKDIDLSTFNNGQWIPLGTDTNAFFSGTLDGQGFSLYNLAINSSSITHPGLFGYVRGANIKNINLYGYIKSTGANGAGGLIGNSYGNGASNSPITTITNVNNFINLESNSVSGGLVGWNSNSARLTIRSSSNNGNITSTNSRAGGLIGYSTSASSNEHVVLDISESYNGGNIRTIGTGLQAVGGLVGEIINTQLIIVASYNSGSVAGSVEAGGLLGYANNSNRPSSFTRVFNSAEVVRSSGSNTFIGSIVGRNLITINNTETYYLNNNVKVADVYGNGNGLLGTAKSLIEMLQETTYSFSDFSVRWAIDEDKTYPYLKDLPDSLNISLNELTEAAANDGTLTNNEMVLSLANSKSSFSQNINEANIVIKNLPSGMSFNLTYLNHYQLKIVFTGSATSNLGSDSTSLEITVKNNGLVNSQKDIITRLIPLNFIAAPEVTNLSINYSDSSNGTLIFNASQVATYYFVLRTFNQSAPTVNQLESQQDEFKGTASTISGSNTVSFVIDNYYNYYNAYLILNNVNGYSSINRVITSIPISTPQELNYIRHLTNGQISFSNGTPSNLSDDFIVTFSDNYASVNNALKFNYHLINDLNMSVYSNSVDFSSTGWVPIANTSTRPFIGKFDGRNFTITNLAMKTNTFAALGVAGLFGYTNNAKLENLKLYVDFYKVGLNTANSRVGALVANANSTIVSNVHTHGIINNDAEGLDYYSGMLGNATGNITILKSSSSVNITNRTFGAGLIGISNINSTIIIEESYNKGSIQSTNGTGAGLMSGFQGSTFNITIRNSYNSGSVSGFSSAGITALGSAGTYILSFENIYNVGTITGNNSASIVTISDPSRITFSLTDDIFRLDTGLPGFYKTAGTPAEFEPSRTTSQTATEIKDPNNTNYQTWTNFANIWDFDININNGFPYLKNNFILIPPQV